METKVCKYCKQEKKLKSFRLRITKRTDICNTCSNSRSYPRKPAFKGISRICNTCNIEKAVNKFRKLKGKYYSAKCVSCSNSKYITNHKILINTKNLNRLILNIEALNDNYIRNILSKTDRALRIDRQSITPELIEIKRKQIQSWRNLQQLKTSSPNQ
jgi:hypothetical protein